MKFQVCLKQFCAALSIFDDLKFVLGKYFASLCQLAFSFVSLFKITEKSLAHSSGLENAWLGREKRLESLGQSWALSCKLFVEYWVSLLATRRLPLALRLANQTCK